MSQGELFPPEAQREVLTVGQLTERIKRLLEGEFPAVWVAGEISNFSRPRSGHCYLTLKDEQAQLSAVVWRSTAARLRFELHDGLEVVCSGRINVYPPHGKYQLVVERMEPKGLGALELAFRQLYEKLAREGLFRAERKRPLPRFVRRVALVTSPTGAAIRDFLQVLSRRWPLAEVLVVPVAVQGEQAAGQIAEAIARVNRLRTTIDCIVVTRGGGSLEDLWAFNEEVVVRAICRSRIPVVSAVGHEIDVTLSDLAADLRALTPSNAAERIGPAADEVLAQLHHCKERLAGAMCLRLETARRQIEAIAGRPMFRRPLEPIYARMQRLDELSQRADRAVRVILERLHRRLGTLTAQLEALSPLKVLARGYSLTYDAATGRVVRAASEVSPGRLLRTRLSSGEITSRVEHVEPGETAAESPEVGNG